LSSGAQIGRERALSIGDPHGEDGPKVERAAALRRLFDEAFAAPAESRPERVRDLLAIRVGSDPYALRLSEIAGLHAGLKVEPVPSPATQLLGIVGIRGVMAPIYDLARLLGYAPVTRPRWVVFTRSAQAVGFAFETFESHLQVSESSLVMQEGHDAGRVEIGRHVRGTVRVGGALRPIVHMASVLAMLGDKKS
jgi:chemotaxis signal transduction protein